MLPIAMISINIKRIWRKMERKSSLIFTYTTLLPLKMRMTRKKEGNSLMESDAHGNKMFPSRGMITLVFLLIRSIPKENAFKSLRVQLETI